MIKNKIINARRLAYNIERCYPRFGVETSACKNEICVGAMLGIGVCAECNELQLSAIIGKDTANAFHQSVRNMHHAWMLVEGKLRG